ncbi:MAG: MIP/aquaporin family protein [Acidimicrobiales bacterium]
MLLVPPTGTSLDHPVLARRVFAETLGSVLLSAVVIGSGIAAQSLSPHVIGLELFENAAATAGGLYVLILMMGPVSGAHFNPIVTLVDAATGGLKWRDVPWYVGAQVAGCVGGAMVANLMFSRASISIATHHRASIAHLFAEVVASAGLILVIFSLSRSGRGPLCASAVATYIGAAYFFTSSTSFANPAITVARMFSDSFAGIAPASVAGFIVAELIGAAVGCLAVVALYPHAPRMLHELES